MVLYQRKNARIVYLHDCQRCKLNREISTKTDVSCKRKIFTRDSIPLFRPDILMRPRRIIGANFDLHKTFDPVKSIKNTLLKRKKLNDNDIPSVKIINSPSSKSKTNYLRDLQPQSVKRILFEDSSKKEHKPLKSISKPAKEKAVAKTSPSLTHSKKTSCKSENVNG